MTILKAILNKLSKVEPFKGDYSQVKESLKHAINICERWIECCHNLTGRLWKASRTHQWENERFSPVSIVGYQKRLAEVLAIRSGREQYKILVKTVKGEGEESAKGEDVFRCFDNVDALQFNPFTETAWREAVQAYDRSMGNMDQRTVEILKMHLRQAQSNPRQVKLALKIKFIISCFKNN